MRYAIAGSPSKGRSALSRARHRWHPATPAFQPGMMCSRMSGGFATRLQETYAGFLEHTDAEIGRLIGYLSGIGRLDNTMIVLMSDNGASAEGGPTGRSTCENTWSTRTEPPAVGLRALGEIGAARSSRIIQPVGHRPRTLRSNGTSGHPWRGHPSPADRSLARRIHRRGAIREQYHHVSDIAPDAL